jgi:hypothetical protein
VLFYAVIDGKILYIKTLLKFLNYFPVLPLATHQLPFLSLRFSLIILGIPLTFSWTVLEALPAAF